MGKKTKKQKKQKADKKQKAPLDNTVVKAIGKWHGKLTALREDALSITEEIAKADDVPKKVKRSAQRIEKAADRMEKQLNVLESFAAP